MQPSLSIENEIVAAIRKIMRAVDLHSHWLVGEFGLTGPQLATLREAMNMEQASPGALARALHLSQPTMSGILDRLEKRGFVQRVRDGQDRRTVSIKITPEGHHQLAHAPPLLQDRFHRKLTKLEEWEQTQILATLQRVAATQKQYACFGMQRATTSSPRVPSLALNPNDASRHL
ncbi:MAG: MarR family transcriptional regulator [Phycisphaerales bacterium]|nr:MarR family transcriptional regulator [Phycisphaerales bacterium]